MATSKLAASLHDSGAETASGIGETVDIGARSGAELVVGVIAVTGTLAFDLQTSRDEELWTAVHTESDITSPKLFEYPLVGLSRFNRIVWTLTGTSTFYAESDFHNIYATFKDVRSLALAADSSFEDDPELIIAASDLVDTELCMGATPPIVDWGASVKLRAAQVLAYLAASKRGIGADGADEILRLNYTDALTWLGKAGTGKRKNPDMQDATPETHESAGYVISSPRREY